MPVRDTTAVVGDSLRIQAAASDPDGDVLHYRAVVALTEWRRYFPLTRFNRTTGVFVFVPQRRDGPQLDVTFYVYDGKCNWDTLGVRIGIVPLE